MASPAHRLKELADALAAEHLQLCIADPGTHAGGRVAGCVFVGGSAATAFGDYAAGSNHVLPTGGSARFGGPLGTGVFMRSNSIVAIPAATAEDLASAVDVIATAEGFPMHAASVTARRNA